MNISAKYNLQLSILIYVHTIHLNNPKSLYVVILSRWKSFYNCIL